MELVDRMGLTLVVEREKSPDAFIEQSLNGSELSGAHWTRTLRLTLELPGLRDRRELLIIRLRMLLLLL